MVKEKFYTGTVRPQRVTEWERINMNFLDMDDRFLFNFSPGCNFSQKKKKSPLILNKRHLTVDEFAGS